MEFHIRTTNRLNIRQTKRPIKVAVEKEKNHTSATNKNMKMKTKKRNEKKIEGDFMPRRSQLVSWWKSRDGNGYLSLHKVIIRTMIMRMMTLSVMMAMMRMTTVIVMIR